MAKAPESRKAAGVSDAAVRQRTGKGWEEWFTLLDQAGGPRMSHKEIAAHLHDRLGCSGWWSQMIAVGYEQERGLREKHQTPTGYQAGRSITVKVPVARLYRAWADLRTRRRWLPDANLAIRKATREKSMRITWLDDGTSLEVNFTARGEDKSQVAIQHRKLTDAAAVAKAKEYWGQALLRLRNLLEKQARKA